MNGRLQFTRKDGGFTTPAAAVALLLVFSLTFACLHGYRTGVQSGQVQYVADAGALAADNVVAEFVTAGQVVDALLFSCTMLGLTVYAVAAVAAFIPGGGGVAAELAQVGSKILQFRDKMAKSAVEGLEQAQKALPALAAARASACIQANATASGIEYAGTAVTFPLDGVEVKLPDDAQAEQAAASIESQQEDIQQKSMERQQAQERLNSAKERAWLADCGSSGMDMQERAAHLAGLSGASNPVYTSVETWSFTVPLQRAQKYYAARYKAEPGASYVGSPELVSESVARKRFYQYARAEVAKGSVSRTTTGLELPKLSHLARNNQQIKQTELYTESVYPVSQNAGARTIHGYTGCPRYQEESPAGTASVRDEDQGTVQRCDVCKFSALTLGRVPSASTSIDNGFEYYYRQVVEAADEYRATAQQLQKLDEELQGHKERIEDDLSKAVESLKGARYDPQPPGRYGCVCIVYAPGVFSGALPFTNADDGVQARVAISGATLAADPADSQGSVIADVAEGLMPESVPGSSILRVALSAWSATLRAYVGSTDSIEGAFRDVLSAIPLVGTDLSSWAADGFCGALSAAGLDPPDLASYKAVLVNTSHVLERDQGAVAQALLSAKKGADAYGAASAGDMQALYDQLEQMADAEGVPADGQLILAELPFSLFGFGLPDVSFVLHSTPGQSLRRCLAQSTAESDGRRRIR